MCSSAGFRLLRHSASMDSSSNGAALDAERCSKLGIEEKRDIVYELSKWTHGAAELLQSWSRQEIMQILCLEMGKERKTTGMTKPKLIEHLLKVINENKSSEDEVKVLEQTPHTTMGSKCLKKTRKFGHPSKLPLSPSNPPVSISSGDSGNTIYCRNSACKASLSKEDKFCKRCTCCICHKFDDNKDPSLWLTCNPDHPYQGYSCNMSCHLECALKYGKCGIMRSRKEPKLDGCFRCASCGKMNDLLRRLRKQLIIAKDTRRVDVLCYRLALSQKLLIGTKMYWNLSGIVDDAVRKLETEVGTLTGIPGKMGRGIVNRMSSGQEIQKLCTSAVELLDSILSDARFDQSSDPVIGDSKLVAHNVIRFEDVCATSVSVILGPDKPSAGNEVGYTLWHHKADNHNEAPEPTCTLFPPETRFLVSGLVPATDYVFKVVCFDSDKEMSTCEARLKTSSNESALSKGLERSQSPTTNCSSLSNPSSVVDETCNTAPCNSLTEKKADNCCNYFKSNGKMDCSNVSNCTSALEGQIPMSTSDDHHPMVKASCIDLCFVLKKEAGHPSDERHGEATSNQTELSNPSRTASEVAPFGALETGLPATPCRRESLEGTGRIGKSKSSRKDLSNGSGKDQDDRAKTTSKKRGVESQDEDCSANDPANLDLAHCVKTVWWLEREGHIDKNFRQNFLTWYSMRATKQELRVVKVFIDTLIEDPAALAEQLEDTFGGHISNERACAVPAGFCLKLWH